MKHYSTIVNSNETKFDQDLMFGKCSYPENCLIESKYRDNSKYRLTEYGFLVIHKPARSKNAPAACLLVHIVMKAKKIFYVYRHVSWLAIACSLAGSLLLFVMGCIKTAMAFATILFGKKPKAEMAHLEPIDVATSYLIHSLDSFLIAFVLFIFAHGIFTLFITDAHVKNNTVLKWIRTPNIGHLKNILAEVIVIILFVKFLEVVLLNITALCWETLILPIAILLLAAGLKILGLNRDTAAATPSEESAESRSD